MFASGVEQPVVLFTRPNILPLPHTSTDSYFVPNQVAVFRGSVVHLRLVPRFSSGPSFPSRIWQSQRRALNKNTLVSNPLLAAEPSAIIPHLIAQLTVASYTTIRLRAARAISAPQNHVAPNPTCANTYGSKNQSFPHPATFVRYRRNNNDTGNG